jgi:choline-glycine betaine transporter
LLQIRRVFFILSVKYFSNIWLLAFSKFPVEDRGKALKPEFKTLSVCNAQCGNGIGLLFWSISEPIYHFLSPPMAEGGTAEAAKEAMKFTFLHWGFHAWAVYALVGLSLAYFTYSRGLPLTIRSILSFRRDKFTVELEMMIFCCSCYCIWFGFFRVGSSTNCSRVRASIWYR